MAYLGPFYQHCRWPRALVPGEAFCVVCGNEILRYDYQAKTWIVQECQRSIDPELHKNMASKRSIRVPDAVVENAKFNEQPTMWTHFFRAFVENPKHKTMSITGIGTKTHSALLMAPSDPEMAGYPVHAHCWLLVDQVIGTGIVKENPAIFIDAVKSYWTANKKDPPGRYLKHANTDCRYSWRGASGRAPKASCRHEIHQPGNPFHIPEVEALKKLTLDQGPTEQRRRQQQQSPWLTSVPLEIAVMLIDTIYYGKQYTRARAKDSANLLRAMGWKLPDSYWIARCRYHMPREVDLLREAGSVTDWAAFCLGLEERMLTCHWYCGSGLKLRCEIFQRLDIMKDMFFQGLQFEEDGVSAD
ncbi:hypothetical protein BJX99DRAFT_254060 [Aspergillus californicus]